MAGRPKGEVPPALNSALMRGTEPILFSRDQVMFPFSRGQAVGQVGQGSLMHDWAVQKSRLLFQTL